jgi:hypothetical protein
MATTFQAQRVLACEKRLMELNESQIVDAKCITSLERTGLHCGHSLQTSIFHSQSYETQSMRIFQSTGVKFFATVPVRLFNSDPGQDPLVRIRTDSSLFS